MSDEIKNLELKDEAIVTYDELSDKYSHFEIAYLSFQKAIEIIRSAVFLKSLPGQKSKYKPAVAVVALKTLCDNPQEAEQFKEQVVNNMFFSSVEETKYDDYNVDEGHLPVSGSSGSE